MSNPVKLNAKQQKAIEVILVGGSDLQAADAAKVDRRTILRWRGLEAFARALLDARAEMLGRSRARLHAATTLAVRALEEVSKDVHNPSARIAAARAIFEFSHEALELEEFEGRLAKLEGATTEEEDGDVVRLVRRDAPVQ